MYLKCTLELTMILDTEKFQKVFDRAGSKSEYVDDEKHVDQSMFSKGILVTYHDKQYKKKVQLSVNPNVILDGDEPDEDNADKLIRKLDKRISVYFGSVYTLDDFNLSKMSLITDIDVRSRTNVADYVRVLKRIRKVKGFSPSRDNKLNEDTSFSLDGNSNGFAFRIYDLEGHLKELSKEVDSESEKLKAQANKSVGLLRVEVRLVKSSAIRALTNELVTSGQIADLCGRGQKIFLEIFTHIVPFGDFYKKDKTVGIICKKVTDAKIRRRMLNLVTLVTEKKSLLLAQKELSRRRISEVMAEFREIELSPVTISKRHDIKQLDNIYKYF